MPSAVRQPVDRRRGLPRQGPGDGLLVVPARAVALATYEAPVRQAYCACRCGARLGCRQAYEQSGEARCRQACDRTTQFIRINPCTRPLAFISCALFILVFLFSYLLAYVSVAR